MRSAEARNPGHRKRIAVGRERQGKPCFHGISGDQFVAIKAAEPTTSKATWTN